MLKESAMRGKTILITGATDGLGRGVARALAGQGHTLLLHGRSQQRLDAVARELGTRVRTSPPGKNAA
jgi:short-subunit dehydrogenase